MSPRLCVSARIPFFSFVPSCLREKPFPPETGEKFTTPLTLAAQSGICTSQARINLPVTPASAGVPEGVLAGFRSTDSRFSRERRMKERG
jgi:hypothetical protein